jgi:hypothetical protein
LDRPHTHPGKINSRLHFVAICLLSAIAFISSSPSFASADTASTCVLRWGVIDTPGSYPQRNDIRASSEINEIVVSSDGKVIYAVDIPGASAGPVVNAGIWKSNDGGISWSPRPSKWLAQAAPAPVFPVAGIALAPENPDFIVAVCMDAAGTRRREVYISEDGGTNWVYSGRIPLVFGPNEQIGAIAVSPGYSYQGKAVRDIMAGSRDPSNGLAQGEIYVLRYPGLAGWKAQGYPGGDVIALSASPSYLLDSTIITISCTTQRTYINLGFRDLGANSCSWNTYPGWPVELCAPDQVGGTASGKGKIITGNLALPSDFTGTSPEKRVVFAACDSDGASIGASQSLDDVYRLNDTVVTRLKVPGWGRKPRVCSIAFAGTGKSGRLLAGGVIADPALASASLWLTGNPLDPCPVWNRSLKAPTGGFNSGFANVKVAFAQDGSIAFAGTGSGNRDTPLKWSDPTGPSWAGAPLDESAFSASIDSGVSWNQLGLIDTRINRFRSVTPSQDGTNVYIGSVNDNGLDSTWRSQTHITGDAWQRVLCVDCPSPVLRLAPDKNDGSVLFLGNQGTARVLQTRDSGQTWQDCMPGAVLQDMAASSGAELYVLQANGLIRRGVFDSAGWLWDKFSDTGLSIAHTIVAQQNNVMASAAMGQICPVSYSTDRGATWTTIIEQSYSSGNRHVAFDEEFKKNRIIYLADDAGGVYRWSIGTSNRWDDMAAANNSYYGVVASGRGILYAAYSPLKGGVDRTIYSRTGIPKAGVSWDSLNVGLNTGVLFRLEPAALTHSGETVWAIDARDYNPLTGVGCLWAFRDTLANHSPWLIAPKGNSLVYCDPVTGRNAQVDLKWEQLSLADAYEVEIAKDSWFDLVVAGAAPATSPFYSPPNLLYPAYYIGDGLLPEAGRTYWWHIRVRRAATGQVIRSHWSYGKSFNVRPGYPVSAPSYPGIEALHPRSEASNIPVYPVSFSWTPLQGSTAYHFVLASDPELRRPIVDEKVSGTAYELFSRLSYGTAYFWQVTPLEPVPGDPGPVYSFTTQDSPAMAAQLFASGDNTTNALIIALILIVLFGLSVQVLVHRRRQL